MDTCLPIVVGITGASGAIYGIRLLNILLEHGQHVHLVISEAATQVIRQELTRDVSLTSFSPGQLGEAGDMLSRLHQAQPGNVWRIDNPQTAEERNAGLWYYGNKDYFAGIASGSFRTAGMVICPCSMGTLAAIAHGLSTNLIQRAADVHLKERRKLIVVPRETPLGSIQLDNMKRLVDAGGVVMPASPGFYHRPESIAELVDFVVARICDHLGMPTKHTKRWGKSDENFVE